MEINSQAPAIARHEITINASSEKVWEVLTNINDWTAWHPNISESKLEGLLQSGTTFRWKSGGMAILSTLQEVEPQRRLSWTGKAIGTKAIHVWILEPCENGMLVRTEESFEGWLVSLLRGMMQGMLDTSLQAWLVLLKQKAEAKSYSDARLT
ncbi:MAG: polyketide cyclase/dehydrase and lipid transport [Pseudanabaena frigida]|uniref:Polyketide cyclase/dehydrase and lipid transport n=1 Tax=Pseudanabaena frigida TaxID=945775 RepID=A0A2W4WHA3_9CYAN|nr:MAG: polyketide cyclase/dehydrase and lipid transport [Pseudanabaena frigida]